MNSSGPGTENKIVYKRRKRTADDFIENSKEKDEKKPHCDSTQLSKIPGRCDSPQPFVLPLLPIPKVNEWCLNTSTVFTGTACRGGRGPPVGAVDIGVSKYAYYFCIALPGVKKDPGEFSCEIRRDGKVCVEGVTSTGGEIVKKYSRVFEMKIQQQCPPGPFRIFFSLPGPVDPSLCSPIFRTDGIFEAVVAKSDR